MALYDPKEVPAEVTTDFTLDDVLAWARTKPRDEEYDYGSNFKCAICQFLIATGRAIEPSVGPLGWLDWRADKPVGHLYDRRIDDAANGSMSGGPNTFGAFADRLEAARGQ